jgi:uncharacterized SAM-binding protein YcdF (DUF218 family)
MNVDLFALVKILSQLVLAPASLVVALVLATAVHRTRWRQAGRVLVAVALAQTVILSFPPVADGLMGLLEAEAQASAALAKPCCYDAILVLGGGVAPARPPGRPEPNLTEGADRVWEAARLFQRGVAPLIVVSGGGPILHSGLANATEAAAMRQFLGALGVPDSAIIEEGASRNTIENIGRARGLLRDKPVALITSAGHMPRALRIARKSGLNVAAFPVDFRADREVRPWWENWIPSADALSMSGLALRELMALTLDYRAVRDDSD